MTNETLALDKIKIDGGTQARAALNEDVVAEYAEAITAGADLPPVVVFQDGKRYWLADGFHRFHAHRKAGAIQIDADVRVGTKREAILHSVGANAAHGLRRTNADKRTAVRTLLADKEWGQWSDRQIADTCGVSAPFVAAIRNPEAAQRQKEQRDSSAARGVASAHPVALPDATPGNHTNDPAETGNPVAAPDQPSAECATAALAVLANVPSESKDARHASAPEAHDANDDGEHDLLTELQQENAQLIELLRVAEADDLVAEALKWRRVAENAERQQSQAMDSASASQKRERWTKTQLMRCGAAVGEEDPAKIARAVELAVQARAAA